MNGAGFLAMVVEKDVVGPSAMVVESDSVGPSPMVTEVGRPKKKTKTEPALSLGDHEDAVIIERFPFFFLCVMSA